MQLELIWNTIYSFHWTPVNPIGGWFGYYYNSCDTNVIFLMQCMSSGHKHTEVHMYKETIGDILFVRLKCACSVVKPQ